VLTATLAGCGLRSATERREVGPETPSPLSSWLPGYRDEFMEKECDFVLEILQTRRPGPRLTTVEYRGEWRVQVVRDRWIESRADGTPRRVICEEYIHTIGNTKTRRMYELDDDVAADRLADLIHIVRTLDHPADDSAAHAPDSGYSRIWALASPSPARGRTNTTPAETRGIVSSQWVRTQGVAAVADEAARWLYADFHGKDYRTDSELYPLDALGALTIEHLIMTAISVFDGAAGCRAATTTR
jgi:hypothetical protein